MRRPRGNISLSIIVPTIGKGVLARCLDSIMSQLCEGDEVLVVGDLREGPLLKVEEEVQKHPFCQYLPLAESDECDWGHSNLNAAMRVAKGSWLTWTDDDDVYTPHALDDIRAAVTEQSSPRPLIFRYRSPFGYVIPPHEGKPLEGHISGQCLVIPNIPDRFGTWTRRYEGDYDMFQSTLAAWGAAGIAPEWRSEIIGLGRPPLDRPSGSSNLEWPASLNSSTLYRFLTGVSPSLPFRSRVNWLRITYALLSGAVSIKQQYWKSIGKLVPIYVETPDLARQMLRICDLCKEGIRFNQWDLDEKKQDCWWESNKDLVTAWIFKDAVGVVVGFGMFKRKSDGILDLNVGVLPQYRGNGYGHLIVDCIIHQVSAFVVAKARIKYPVECSLYENDHWQAIDRDEHHIYYRTRGQDR